MTTYDTTGNPILPAGVEEFLDGNPSTFIDRFIRTRFGPIVKGDGEGKIADDPSDVTVLVNSTPATVKAVLGLIGIVVLEDAPLPTDTVKIWYDHLSRPRVEFRRLNSVEFVLNADGNRAWGYQRYLYENVLIDPSIDNPLGFQGGAVGTDPELFGYFYRAYERAYSIALNDPNLLLLNSPHHRIAYPPFSRGLYETLVSYDGNVLPENHVTYPWDSAGSGISSVDGRLTIEDNSSGAFPTGKGYYYYRPEDLSFQYTMSFSYRSKVTSYTLTGCFSGVASGFIDGRNLCLIACIEDSGTKYIGILKKGGDETIFSSYESYELDWSEYHIFRLYRTIDQVRLYVDGGAAPILTVSTSDLADPNELELQIDFITGTFFGSMSRNSVNVSEWDYLRYLITPISPSESAHYVNVLYEANSLPTEAGSPWFKIGAFGTERLLGIETLLLNKISASEEPYSSEGGLISGEVFGYHRPEPFLSSQSVLALDWKVRGYSWTHGVSERSLGVFANDYDRLLAISFFSDVELPLLSYNGQVTPDTDPETPWTPTGTATIEVVDNILNIDDSSDTGGILYGREDVANNILGHDQNYIYEFRAKVNSYSADPSGFIGVLTEIFDGVPGTDSGPLIASLTDLPVSDSLTVTGLFSPDDVDKYVTVTNSTQGNNGTYQIVSYISADQVQVSPSFPGTIPETGTGVRANMLGGYPGRNIQVMLREEGGGTKVISFASEGTVLSSIAFTWNDSEFHTYRVIVNQDSDLVMLMVDGLSKGTLAYTSFTESAGDTAYFEFGSSGPSSDESISNVDWDYFNSYPIRSSSNEYVGIYKGGDVTDIDNYEKVSVDFSSYHEYRVVRDPNGSVSLFIDGALAISFSYLDLPDAYGTFFDIEGGAGSGVYWGSFDESALVLSEWDYLRFTIAGAKGFDVIAPHHEILNQQNVIASPDHIYGDVADHSHTNFLSSSTGIPTPIEDYYDKKEVIDAYTQLNQDTPPVPLTEEAFLTKVESFIVVLNDPLFVLNDFKFLINDASKSVELQVNERGLYNALDLRSKTTGNIDDHIYPAFDKGLGEMEIDFTGTLCFEYDGTVVPEDTVYPSGVPDWGLEGTSDYQSYASDGKLTFSSWGSGTKSYVNYNPIFGARFPVDLEFSLKVTQDISSGAGDTLIRFELRNDVFPIRFGLATSPLGEKLVKLFSVSLPSEEESIIGNISFNWDDGSAHIFKLHINPYYEMIKIFIDNGERSYMDIPFSRLEEFPSSITDTTSLRFTPKVDVANLNLSEIEIDYINFCVARNDSYEIPVPIDPRFFYLNAYDDFTYSGGSGYTVLAKSLMNSTDSIMYPGSKFSEAFPSTSIDGQIEEIYDAIDDFVVQDEVVLTYPFGGNRMNDPDSTMELDMVTGFLLNDATPGYSEYPLVLNPLIDDVWFDSITIDGSGLIYGSPNGDHGTHSVIITGDGARTLTGPDIISGGGTWTDTQIYIPNSLVPGINIGSTDVKVIIGSYESNVEVLKSRIVPAADPTSDVSSGSYDSAQSVTLSTTTPGVDIWYTLDGSDPVPTTNGIQYTTPIDLPGDYNPGESYVLKAITAGDGVDYSDSNIVTWNIDILLPEYVEFSASYNDTGGELESFEETADDTGDAWYCPYLRIPGLYTSDDPPGAWDFATVTQGDVEDFETGWSL